MLDGICLPDIPVCVIFRDIDVLSNSSSFWGLKKVPVNCSAKDLREAVKETELGKK